jgi:hypothetical protein
MKPRSIILSLLFLYVIMYMCIYTAYASYVFLNSLGFHPEIRSKDMLGTSYAHAYVHLNGIDIFLNPFRNYSKDYTILNGPEDLKNYNNWVCLYIFL